MTSVPVNQIICADNVETLRTLPDACVDSCVTDPPYPKEFLHLFDSAFAAMRLALAICADLTEPNS